MSTRDLSALQDGRFERFAVLDLREANLESRTVPASLSSESPVDRFFGREILVHDSDAVDLSRAGDGLPLLWNHNTDEPIGVVERIKIKDGKLRGVLRFSNNKKAIEVFNDVRDGFLKNISIGYQVNKFEEQANSNDIRVTGWTLLESSVVTVPADASVGINRSLSGVNAMSDDKQTPAVEVGTTDNTGAGSEPVVPIRQIDANAVRAKAVLDERNRLKEIDGIFANPIVPRDAVYDGIRAQALHEGWSADQTRKIVMETLGGEAEPVSNQGTVPDDVQVFGVASRAQPAASPAYQPRPLGAGVRMGEDQTEKFRNGFTEAMLVKAGVLTDRKSIDGARAGGFVGKRLIVLAGDYCRMHGINTQAMDDDTVAFRALTYRAAGQTTSDFTNILANVANKSLLQGWEEAPETWQTWTRRGTLPDFKTAEISGLSGFTGLDEVPEDGDITYGKFTDRKETIKLVSYAKKYRITRKLIINDDLRALSAIPRAMGRAGNRKVGDITYALLNGTGPTLNQDSTALFDTSSHKNYVAAATAPTVATLNTASVAMAKQTDPNTGAVLNIQPRFLMVPKALEHTARVLMAATYDPAGTAGTLPPNPFSGRYEVITDARLDGQTYGTAAWYLLADPNIFDTFEVAFLNGMAEPYMRENEEWDGQGTSYLVGVDFGVSALDFRSVHKYRGN